MNIAAEDPAEAARRLEEALERIAGAAMRGITRRGALPAGSIDDKVRDELTARLDSLIANLRAALARPG